MNKGYDEAALYAHELNKHYPAELNPCCLILACNGVDVRVGRWDAKPVIACALDDVVPGTQSHQQFLDLMHFERIKVIASDASAKIKIVGFKCSFNTGSGATYISSKIQNNTFAADLGPILQRYFTSHEQNDDREIYERAYISSDEVSGYDRTLRSLLKDRFTKGGSGNRVQLAPKKHTEPQLAGAIKDYATGRRPGGVLQLITGGVGSGKSLFARRYKEVLQPAALSDSTHWAFVDFNKAPPSLKAAEEWLCDQVVKSWVAEGAPVDLRNGDDQERVFAGNLADRSAFYKRMNDSTPGRGGLELARDIEQWRQDPKTLCMAMARYLSGDRGENIVVVFDNIDRRESDDQLDAFNLARWFMAETRAFIMLQLRDVTFEQFKDQPPLDTYKSGTVFHISPPRFVEVVKQRLELALKALADEAPEEIEYVSPGGARIKYPKSRAGLYLRSIYSEIFVKPRNISRVLDALSGRNVRRALDMFMAIINSGHIPEDLISAVAQGNSNRSIPEFQIIRILMRTDYRFYSERSGFVSNIFHTDTEWERPSNFLLIEVLFFLIGCRKVKGDNGLMGYVSIARLFDELEKFGFVKGDAMLAVQYALRNELVEADSFTLETPDYDDCIKATASGWAHMRILSERLEYLEGVLPVTPISDERLRAQIFDQMRLENERGYTALGRKRELVLNFHAYLTRQVEVLKENSAYRSAPKSGAMYVLSKIAAATAPRIPEVKQLRIDSDWLDV